MRKIEYHGREKEERFDKVRKRGSEWGGKIEEVRGNKVSEKKRERRDCEERIMSKKSC